MIELNKPPTHKSWAWIYSDLEFRLIMTFHSLSHTLIKATPLSSSKSLFEGISVYSLTLGTFLFLKLLTIVQFILMRCTFESRKRKNPFREKLLIVWKMYSSCWGGFHQYKICTRFTHLPSQYEGETWSPKIPSFAIYFAISNLTYICLQSYSHPLIWLLNLQFHVRSSFQVLSLTLTNYKCSP